MLKLIILLQIAYRIWAADVCCPQIGCFNDNFPYNGQPLPKCLEDMNPRPTYTMYTRSNRNNGQAVTESSVPSVYDSSRRTVFMAHGWQSSGSTSWLGQLKDSFLDREDVNAVIVDWQGGADIINYPQAAANTRSAGALTALVMDNLMNSGGLSRDMWCTGHSLGAHMCGHAGMTTSTIIERVTGMDPAGPWFEGVVDNSVGLNPNSARFVDVIHTDDDTLGTERNLGHIDFYPAGGKDQPGCTIDISGCSHGRAHTYMITSVQNDCFLAWESCTDYNNIPGSCSACTCGASPCGIMGYGAENGCRTSGLYYVPINSNPPHCDN